MMPFVSVVIAARPGDGSVPSRKAARALDYPGDRLEILVARGTQPSAQRNEAVRQARGELIYFLDDDSIPDEGNLRRAAEAFKRSDLKILGGPSLCPEDASWLERAFSLAMSSWLAAGPSRARYCRAGGPRAASEKELILCNLVARREAFLEAGGLDEALYPNEENALMDKIAAGGGALWYDPDFVVYRRPRRTLPAYARMVFTYGRGRAEQFRVHPTPGSALNFVPPLFVLWILAAPWLPREVLNLWILYAIALVAQSAAMSRRANGPGWSLAIVVMPLLMLTHVGYGLGFWRGLFTALRRPENSAARSRVIETIEREELA